MYIVNMASGCTHEETSLGSLNDLDNVSILLDKDNDLEGKNSHLFKTIKICILRFKNMYRKYKVISNDFKYVF